MAVTRRDFLRRAGALSALYVGPTLSVDCVDETARATEDVDGGGSDDDRTFEHGVASGDPLVDAVILWTRVTPRGHGPSTIPVLCEVGVDPSFRELVFVERVAAGQEHDYAVRVDAAGLEAGTTYYYRFSALGRSSPIGRTRTAPETGVDRLRFAVCACSNYGAGYFHGYRALAERNDLDAVIHLGDYIYEYASAGHGETFGTTRPLDPPHEILTLDDYRRRYSWYRRDPDLQELHRQHPIIHLWDDHEFANDPFAGGARNHDPATEGDWGDRMRAALRAYGEWMPTRLRDGTAIFRALPYGGLATIAIADRQRRRLWPAPDDADAQLGREQAEWLDATIAKASSTWFLLAQASGFTSRNADGIGGSSWNAGARERVVEAIEASTNDNLVVLGGDWHRAEALDVALSPTGEYDRAAGVGSYGVELLCGSISSPGSNASTEGKPHFHWSEGTHRHYLVVDLTAAELRADWYGFPDAGRTSPERPLEQWRKGFRAASGSPFLESTDAPAPSRDGAPPLAPQPRRATERDAEGGAAVQRPT